MQEKSNNFIDFLYKIELVNDEAHHLEPVWIGF